MYAPNFVITNKLVRTIGSIEASKEIITSKTLPSNLQADFLEEALLKKIYFATHIEGNELTMMQTKQILEGASSVAQNIDVQEVINYRRTLNLIDELEKLDKTYLVDWLRDIHSTLSYNILPPEKSGILRSTQVVIRDEETNEVVMTPPPALQVPSLLDELFTWINTLEAHDIHPIIRASIAHAYLISVHPFVEGTAPAARMFSRLILVKEGYGLSSLLSFEEKIEADFDNYFEVFFGNANTNVFLDGNLTPIIEYFSDLLATSFSDIKIKFSEVKELTPTKFKVGEEVPLSSRQMKLLEYISENGRAVMKELKAIVPNVSDDTILRDLTALSKRGIIEKEGTTKASSYILKR